MRVSFVQNTSEELKKFLTDKEIKYTVDPATGFIGIDTRGNTTNLFFIGIQYGEYLAKKNHQST